VRTQKCSDCKFAGTPSPLSMHTLYCDYPMPPWVNKRGALVQDTTGETCKCFATKPHSTTVSLRTGDVIG